MCKSFVCLCIYTFVILAVPAHAVTKHMIYVDGASKPSTIAGSASDRSTSKLLGENAFLWGLTFDEKGNKPCYIQLHGWRFTTKSRENFEQEFDICNGDADGDRKAVFHSRDIDLPAVDSISVCQSSEKNPRLKGVTLTAAAIDHNGSARVDEAQLTRTFERANCSNWSSTRACPTGQVAVGIDIHHTSDEITGIALRCVQPRIGSKTDTPTPAALTMDERYQNFSKDIRVQVDQNGRVQAMSLKQANERHEVNGLSVVILASGEVERVRHYGVKSRKTEAPVDDDTIYQAASMSKLPASMAMLMFRREPYGSVLTRNVRQVARKYPNTTLSRWVDQQFKGEIEAGFPEDITIERLLTHTAGLDTHGIGVAGADHPTEMKTILLGGIGNPGVRPQSVPGTIWDYSGGGYTVAEAIFDAQSSLSPTTYLTDNILTPLKMTKSTYRDASDDMKHLARGCSRGICSEKPDHTEVKFAGGLLAHPEEFARLLLTLVNDGRDPNDTRTQVIEPNALKRLFTPASHRDSSRKECAVHGDCRRSERCYNSRCIQPLSASGEWYGLGLYLAPDEDFNGYPRYIRHGGDQTNAHSEFKLDRKQRSGIVVFVAGDSKWRKDGVTYGASALLSDILDAYDRNY